MPYIGTYSFLCVTDTYNDIKFKTKKQVSSPIFTVKFKSMYKEEKIPVVASVLGACHRGAEKRE